MSGTPLLAIAAALVVGIAASPAPSQRQDAVMALTICEASSCAGVATCVSVPVVQRDGSLDMQSACRRTR